jgi:SAM-dependent methyltransferase
VTWHDMPWHWHEDNERGRPGYPPEALDVADLPPTATVLDLAAGTGKLTRLLLTRFGHVAAVEPDGRMRHLLARLCPEAEVIAGRADQIPLADASVDAVFIAQAFHWFDDEPAVAEITRVMRRHGTLVAMWNVPTGPPQPSIPAVERLLEQSWPNDFELPLDLSPNGWSPKAWQLAFTRSALEEHSETRLPNPRTVDPEGLIAFFGSMDWIARLPDQERIPLLNRVRSLLTTAEYLLPWETHIHWRRSR